MAYLLVQHTVEDYDKWKPYFDGHAATRKASGSKSAQVFRSASNPNEITILFEWDSVANAQKFAQSSDLREVMQKAGVTSQPHVTFLEVVDKQPA
jgi:heme-degrading monooxygenase HmoA